MNGAKRFAACAALIWLGQACSALNREGPALSCQELDYGTKNACEAGIIASCRDGKQMTYRVCSESEDDGTPAKEICGASWQQPGAFRCSYGEPVPQ